MTMGSFPYNANSQQEADWLKAKNKVLAIAARAYKAVYGKLGSYRDAVVQKRDLKPMVEQVGNLEGLYEKWVAANDEAEAAKNAYVAFILAGGEYPDWNAGSAQGKGTGEQNAKAKLPSYTFPDKITITGSAPAGFTVVNSSPGGSTGAMIVEKDGLKYVFKQQGVVSGEHIENEAVADATYRAAGIRVPDCRTYQVGGKTYKLAQFIDGGTSLKSYMAHASAADRERVKRELLEGYPVDVLLGNWDVLGMNQDNVLVDKDGHPWRIDNGSAFNYRATGAKKDKAQWEGREFPDEWRTLREGANNRGVFDGYTAHDIWQAAGKIDFDALVANLPPEQKTPSIVKCAAEMKQMAVRCAQYDASGYVPDETSRVLEGTYDLSKEGMREAVASIRLTHTGDHQTDSMDYGAFRPGGTFGTGVLSGKDKQMADAVAKIQAAAKSINYHLQNGDPANAATIQAAVGTESVLAQLKAQGIAVGPWEKALGKIKAVQASGTLAKIQNVKDYVPANGSSGKGPKYGSISEWTYDFVCRGGRTGATPNPKLYEPIKRWQNAQEIESWFPDSCLKKIFEYRARGLNPDPSSNEACYGFTPDQKKWYKDAWAKYQAMGKAERERWETSLAAMRAANQIIFENADLPTVDKATGTIIVARTEDRTDTMPNLKDENGKKVKVGGFGTFERRDPGASASVFETVVVKGSALTIQRVPISRLSGNYLIKRKTAYGWGDSFLGDGENEVNVDMCDAGQEVFYAASSVSRGKDVTPFVEQFKKAEAIRNTARASVKRPR